MVLIIHVLEHLISFKKLKVKECKRRASWSIQREELKSINVNIAAVKMTRGLFLACQWKG